jgi:hypothetical protein
MLRLDPTHIVAQRIQFLRERSDLDASSFRLLPRCCPCPPSRRVHRIFTRITHGTGRVRSARRHLCRIVTSRIFARQPLRLVA